MKWIVEAESIDDVVLGNYAICDTPLTECKDCKHFQIDFLFDLGFCDGRRRNNDDFCSRSERRTDENNNSI